MKHKFEVGDTVRVEVAKRKIWMSHFETGFVGILGRNYKQQFGGSDKNSWTVFHPKIGSISWYDTEDLVLVTPATNKSRLKARELEDR